MLRIALPALVAIALSSCASIVAPGPDRVMITSEPGGAEVFVEGKSVGVTPVEAEISRSVAFITLCKPGWADAKVSVTRHMNGWVWGNILFGGLIGIIVDSSNGNAQKADEALHGKLWKMANGEPDPIP